jgi:hypothetical protein
LISAASKEITGAGSGDVHFDIYPMWVVIQKWLDANKGSGTASQTAHQAGLLPLMERQLRFLYSYQPGYQDEDWTGRTKVLEIVVLAVEKVQELKCG